MAICDDQAYYNAQQSLDFQKMHAMQKQYLGIGGAIGGYAQGIVMPTLNKYIEKSDSTNKNLLLLEDVE